MSTSSRAVGVRLAVAIAVSTSCAAVARAQDAPAVDPRQRQSLIVTFSADHAVDAGAAALPTLQAHDSINGVHTNVRGSVAFKRQPRRYAFTLNASSSAAYYPGLDRVLSAGHSLNASFATSLGRHTRVSMVQQVHRSPFYQLTPFFAGDSAAVSPLDDFMIFRWNNTSSSTGVIVTHEIGRRSSITMNYAASTTWLEGETFAMQSATAGYNYRITRYATARVGYGRRRGGRRAALAGLPQRSAESHDVDLGVDYSRPLSLSKRTTLAFYSGSSMVPSEGGTHVHLSGGASLTREIRRSWSARLDYGRALQLVETHDEPLLIDSLSLQIGGQVINRLNLGVSTSLTQGQAGFGAGDRSYATYLAAARARWSMSRTLTVYADSSFYRHNFGAAVEIAPRLERHMDSVQFRVGVMTSFPVFR